MDGGVPTVFPQQAGDYVAGQPACRLTPDNPAGGGGIPAGLFIYKDYRTAAEKLGDDASVIDDGVAITLGDVVDSRDSFVGKIEEVGAKAGEAVTSILTGTLSTLALVAALGFGIYLAIKGRRSP
jgi:hypothetical protein